MIAMILTLLSSSFFSHSLQAQTEPICHHHPYCWLQCGISDLQERQIQRLGKHTPPRKRAAVMVTHSTV
jgi:hypothetical protein